MTDLKNLDTRPEASALLTTIKDKLSDIEELRCLCDTTGTDGIYRFYHSSFKVYHYLQPLTEKVVAFLRSIDPKSEKRLDTNFELIVAQGTGHTFHLSHNENWPQHTRPIVEAYLHCEYFLRQLVQSASLEYPPNRLPECWAAVLTLFNIR